MKEKAVCLLSGGLDSATVLFSAICDGCEVAALTIDYGQLHSREVASAKKLADICGVDHVVLDVPMPWKGSALLDADLEIPKKRTARQMASGIPATYVPARNTVFLSLAASCAEAKSASRIYIGANAIDYSGYPDCRPEYFRAVETMLALGTKCGVEGRPIVVHAPLLQMTKADIIRFGMQLGVPYEYTWSCYAGGKEPCGECDSCELRAKGFAGAGFKDPLFAKAREKTTF